MAIQSDEHPLHAKQLEARCGGAVKERTWREWMRREVNPMPHIVHGSSARPHRTAYAEVADAMLMYEQGVASYAEVEQAARQRLVGARS